MNLKKIKDAQESKSLYEKWGFNTNSRPRVSLVYRELKSQGILQSIKRGTLKVTINVTDELRELISAFGLDRLFITIGYALSKIGSDTDFDKTDVVNKDLLREEDYIKWNAAADHTKEEVAQMRRNFYDNIKEVSIVAKSAGPVSVDEYARAARRLKKKFPELHVGASSAEKYGTSKDWVTVDGPLNSLSNDFLKAARGEGLTHCANPSDDRLLLSFTPTGHSTDVEI